MRAHRVCRACGMYRGRQVIAIARPTTDDEE
jgi:ribosomal protein L32